MVVDTSPPMTQIIREKQNNWKRRAIFRDAFILGLQLTSSPPCWMTINKRILISFDCSCHPTWPPGFLSFKSLGNGCNSTQLTEITFFIFIHFAHYLYYHWLIAYSWFTLASSWRVISVDTSHAWPCDWRHARVPPVVCFISMLVYAAILLRWNQNKAR